MTRGVSWLAVALACLLWGIVCAYVGFIGWKFNDGHYQARIGETPLYTDFTTTYAAAMILHSLPPEYVYHEPTMVAAGAAAAQEIYGELTAQQTSIIGFSPFMYPPTFMFAVKPLAKFPYYWAWAIWLILTALPLFLAFAATLQWRWLFPLILAAPPSFFNAMYGQTGFLIAGLIALGLVMLRQQPILAGILIGFASVKPHLGLLIPVALVCGGHWRSFSAAALTVVLMILFSAVVFGDEAWFAFIGTSLANLEGFGHGVYSLPPMTTMFAAMQMLGLTVTAAAWWQLATTTVMALLVGWTWRTGRHQPNVLPLQSAVLCLAAAMSSPMLFLYDLVIVIPAALWIGVDMAKNGGRRWELPLLIALLGMLLPVKAVGESGGIQIAPILLFMLLGLALFRYRLALDAIATRGVSHGTAAV